MRLKRNSNTDDYLVIICHDAFRYGGGLNKSSAEVYWCLSKAPMTAHQLKEKTGRSKATIFRCLKSMSNIIDNRTGEIFSMVKNEKGVWRLASNIDLNQIAIFVGTDGALENQKQKHARERKVLRDGSNEWQTLVDGKKQRL